MNDKLKSNAFAKRINIMPPSEIIVTTSSKRFSSTTVKFDANVETFDKN